VNSGIVFLLVPVLLSVSAMNVSVGDSLSGDYLRAELLEQLPDAGIERVYYSGPGTLTISQGDRAEVRVEASEAIRASVVIEVSDGALFIETPVDSVAGELHVKVILASVSEVVSDGNNVIKVENLTADRLSLEASGPGSVLITALQANELNVTGSRGAAFSLSGNVNRQVLDLADHGLYQARQLVSRSVEAKVVGGGAILLQVDDLLDVRVAGAANVRYAGSPFVSQRVSGPGSVKPVAEIFI
jgi:hypothetical protein